MKKVEMSLVGLNGNAFVLLGTFQKNAKRQGWTPEEINPVIEQATSGDYNNLLATLQAYIDDK